MTRIFIQLIINKSDINLNKAAELEQIASEFQVDLLGMVPYDKSTTEAQMQNKTLIEYDKASPASLAVVEIWNTLTQKVKL